MLPAKPFTSADVKFTFDCVLNKHVEAAHIRSYYEDPNAKDDSERIQDRRLTEVVDDYTVKIRWKKPYFQLAKDFTLNGARHHCRRMSTRSMNNGDPISSDFSSC